MLIANSDFDLDFVFRDVELVGQAALRCELCKDSARVVKLFDKTATEIRAALEDLAAQLEADDKVLLWYAGHGYSDETGATLLVTQPELSDVDEDVEVVDGLWLEDTVYDIFEPKNQLTLTIWCVDASCREKKPAGRVWEEPGTMVKERWMRPPERVGHRPQPDSNNTYAFMYACCIGKVMLDSAIFATGFCYQLECWPRYLKAFQEFLEIDCEIITFGDLKPPAIQMVGRTHGVQLKTKQRTIPPDFPEHNPMWIPAMRRARLVADHLHYLAILELLPKAGSCSSPFDSGCSSASDSDPYRSYVQVRAIAPKIIRSFFEKAEQFEELHQQLRLLRCNSLAEVQEQLSPSSSSSASDELAQWNPCGYNEWTLDMRVLQNLPKEVIHEIGEAHRTWKEKWNEERLTDYPTEPIFEMLRMLGCFYTERKFPGTIPTQKHGEVLKYIEDYFKIFYFPGASFAPV